MTLQQLAETFSLTPEQTTVTKPTLAIIRRMLKEGYVMIGEVQGLAVFAYGFQIRDGLAARKGLLNQFN